MDLILLILSQYGNSIKNIKEIMNIILTKLIPYIKKGTNDACDFLEG